MAIVGLGIDIIKIQRIKKIHEKYKDTFAQRILTITEFCQYKKNYNKSIRFLAKRFAAKEAALKALGLGLRKKLSFIDFEISNNKSGKPLLKLLNYAYQLKKKLKINKIHVSITDEKEYACALVILEKL